MVHSKKSQANNPLALVGERDQTSAREERPRIWDVDPKTRWYQENSHGAIKLIRPIISKQQKLTDAVSIALALTEVCCDAGKGKVFLVIGHPYEDLGLERGTVPVRLWGLPELFYVPDPWSAMQQEEWNGMNPGSRLEHLQSRHGWVGHDYPVLPLALDVLRAEDKSRLQRHERGTAYIQFEPRPRIGMVGGPYKLLRRGKDIPAELDKLYTTGASTMSGGRQQVTVLYRTLRLRMLEAMDKSRNVSDNSDLAEDARIHVHAVLAEATAASR